MHEQEYVVRHSQSNKYLNRKDHESQICDKYDDPATQNVLPVGSVVFKVVHRRSPFLLLVRTHLFTPKLAGMWVFPQMGYPFGELFTESTDRYQRKVYYSQLN